MKWTKPRWAQRLVFRKWQLALVLVSAGLVAVLQGTSFAAFDQVVTWSDMSSLDLKPVFRSQYASQSNLFDPVINPSATEIALRDADSLINPEFHVPPSLRLTVEFWLKIYTQYSTQNVVIFDSKHPEIVYEVLDFRELSKTARNAVVYEILRKKRVEKAVAKYRQALNQLARRQGRGHLSPEQEAIVAAMKNVRHRHTFREMAQNVRAQTGQRDNIVKGLLAAETFFPKMEELFLGMGVPVELTRLSLVESSFDLSANSRVGAAGVWQLMPGPGHKFLTIDYGRGIDERRSPLKSTVAAAKMLKENYVMFKNWPLAVTSYNHGLKGLMQYRGSHAVHSFKEIAHLFDPCSKKGSPLGYAGRNYYAEFLAVLHAEAYRNLFYGAPPVAGLSPIAFVRLEKRERPLEIAKAHGISVQELGRANPDILNLNRPLPKGYWVSLPGESDDLAGLMQTKRGRAATSSNDHPTKRSKSA